MSTEDREISWAEAAEISRRTLLDAEARRTALAEREAAGLDCCDGEHECRAIAAGWLPPDKAERLKAERDQAIAHDRQPYPTSEAYETACHAVHYYRDIAQSATALLVQESASSGLFATEVLEFGRQLRAKVESGSAPSLPDFPTLVAQLAAVQPVIDAARAFVAAARNPAHRQFWRQPWAEMTAVLVAVDALDADGQPEGPTT